MFSSQASVVDWILSPFMLGKCVFFVIKYVVLWKWELFKLRKGRSIGNDSTFEYLTSCHILKEKFALFDCFG